MNSGLCEDHRSEDRLICCQLSQGLWGTMSHFTGFGVTRHVVAICSEDASPKHRLALLGFIS